MFHFNLIMMPWNIFFKIKLIDRYFFRLFERSSSYGLRPMSSLRFLRIIVRIIICKLWWNLSLERPCIGVNRGIIKFIPISCKPCARSLIDSGVVDVIPFILLHEKFLQSDWLIAVVFQLNLKYLHVKIANLLWEEV